ncbi:MAG TPA: nuclear transport factor 2 family protein [Bacteroidetes bacterium]|nr:nuclear transport factor 2 family protein [Bacteroidota bacterium]HIL57553.1 nuclear transport factor 2 family protein [Rhodothermales bacterium]
MTLTPTQALQNYLAAWNAPDAEAASQNLLACCVSDVVLIDPNARLPVQGWGSIAGHIASAREALGPLQMEATSGIDAHHGVCRLSWQLADGPDVRQRGLLIAEAAPDGRLRRVIHFVDA